MNSIRRDLRFTRSGRPTIATRLLSIALLSASLAPSAHAQRAESIQAGFNVARSSANPRATKKVSTEFAADTTRSRVDIVAHDALIGAAIGAGTGIVVAFIGTHQASVTDHSEDGLAYIALASFGALLGLIGGSIFGLVRD